MIKKATINDLNIINYFFKAFDNIIINEDELLNHPFSRYVLCINNEKIVGFLDYALIYDKMELNYIYVIPEERKNGYAKEMMDYLLNEAEINHCSNITLEVSKSNEAAIKLYTNYGFKIIATRPQYYKNIDGLLMERILVIK